MSTWYVRPNTSHGSTRNGTSYATAWGGWSEIVWGSGGVVGGDTLYVCGAHSYTASIALGNHGGTSGSRCVIRGDWPGDPGVLTFTAAGFLSQSRSYTTVMGLTIYAIAGSPCVFQSGGPLAGTYYWDNTLVGGTYGIQLSAAGVYTDLQFNRNKISGQTKRGISYAPTTASSVFGPIQCNDNVIADIGTGQSVEGEGIRFTIESAAWDTSTWADVEFLRNNIQRTRSFGLWIRAANPDFFTPVVVYSASCKINDNYIRYTGLPQVGSLDGSPGCMSVHGFTYAEANRNTLWDNYVAGAGVQTAKNKYMLVLDNDIRRIRSGHAVSLNQGGFPIDGNGIFFDILTERGYARGNYVEDLISTGLTNSGTAFAFWKASNCVVEGNIAVNCYRGASYGNNLETGNKLINNTFVRCDVGVTKLGTEVLVGALTARNNLFLDCPVAYSIGTNPHIDENFSFVFGATTAYSGISAGAGSVVNADISAAKVSVSYRPLPGSPLIGAGTHLGYTRDLAGVQRPNPPSIGAYDLATLRRF